MRSFRASAVPLGRLAGRLALCAALLTLQVGSVAWGAPSGATVVRGKVKITQKGNKTIIRASNKSIITYDSFNIAKGETVRFIQPSSKSRVLNRVLGGGPTHINGSLFANGRVYIVNRAGVRFGRGSIVDVGSLYAAAGAISNRDFLAGVDRFTDLRGSVINHGSIHAKDSIHMLGRVVANYGAVVAESGFVTMVAGDEVTLGQRDGHIHVKVSGGDPTMTAPAVINDGTIVASRKAVLGAGDLYSFAIRNTGTVKASEISVKAAQGKVEVSGTLDASDRSPEGVGGHIEVLGERVALEGATLDASGTLGGGTVEVGGGFQGSGDVTAARTFVDGDTVILSNAVSVGDGGTVVVWADELTWFFGEAQAMGGELSGDGGLIEVSGKQALVFRGDIDVRGDAPGALLLDPDTLTVVDGPGPAAQDADVADAQNFFGDPPPAFTISEAALEDLGNAATILLRANVSITIDPLTDNTLLLSSDGGGGSLAFEVGPGGTFTMDGADTINTVGVPLSITAPGGITLGGVIASDVTLVSDAVALNGTVTGTGALVVRQSTAATPIDIGDDVAGAGGMALSQVEVGLIQEGFTSIAIGNPAAGAVEINDGTGISFSDPLTVTSGVGITIDGAGLRGTDNASILLDGPGATTVLNTDVTSEGEPITFSDAVVIGAPLVAIDTTLGGNPGGAAITFESPGSIEGATPGGESLSLNGGATGFIMVSGPVGAANGLDVVTVTNSGNTIFGDTFQANTVDLAATAVEIAFMGDTLIQSALTTANEGYAVRFGGLNNSVAGLTEFLNTGTVVLAQGGGFTQFVDGAETAGNTSNPLLTRIGGEVGTANGPLILGPTDLTGSSVVAATGGGVSLGDVAGGGFNLTVNSGGSATLDGAMTALGRLTLDGGGATQPGGSIAATELLLTGVGAFDLPRPANDFGVAAAAVTGPVTLTDATGLTVGAVGGTAGIHSGGGDVTVNTGNTLAIGTGL
ncbi:filamentous hemagglutinin N-terminal domain-containing protein, partial [bacterium]|nr:filamentous hemagglutinin N-terminal domain-containing protein [bacterium]